MRYLVPALNDLSAMLKGRRVAPIELFEAPRKSLHFVGYEGLSMIAASGLDMAAWDALANFGVKRYWDMIDNMFGKVLSFMEHHRETSPSEIFASDRKYRGPIVHLSPRSGTIVSCPPNSSYRRCRPR
jgi:L-alanine-DL-glutamate epimerase-like enolase superfamily enzyme